MRHSTPELTANVYTDPMQLDVPGAVNALPAVGGGLGAGADADAKPARDCRTKVA